MYSIFGWGYGQVTNVCSVRVVLCLGSVHELLKWWTWRLQSYICTWRYIEELYWRATYIGSHTWKQLNVNCGGYIFQWRL